MTVRTGTLPSPHGAPARSITIEHGSLRRFQKVHAVAIVVLPALGLAAGLAMAWRVGLTTLDLALFVGMFVLTMLGISAGYHRHFSHRSFRANRPVRVFLGICGSMAAQGSVSYWVSNHRRHHHYADRPGDLHSPYYAEERRLGWVEGFWHAHMGWTFNHDMTNPLVFGRDLYRDRAIARVSQLYLAWVALGLAIPFALGGLLSGTWTGAVSGLLWGGFARMFFCYHFTNGIDSVTHIFGRRPFVTQDYSTNNAWMALPTMGEGWHNNHHAFPSSAIFGFRWWQIDPGAWLIRGFEKAGWAWDVQLPPPNAVAQKSRQAT
jgi:stearoyl-CoA desaturase (delta-9 desaturase)